MSFRFGYFYIGVSALLFAITGTASKFLFNHGVTPYQLVQIRTVISTLVLLGWLFITNRNALYISKRNLLYLVPLGFILTATMFTYFFAISKIQVAAAILLQYQSPVFVALYVWIYSRERHSSTTLIALVGTGIGCYLAIGAYSIDLLNLNKYGIIAGLSSAAFLAGYTLLSESALRLNTFWAVLFYSSLFSAVSSNLFINPFEGVIRPYDAVQWFWILFISAGGTISLGFYNKGIRLIRSTHSIITSTLQPIAAAVIAFVFLGEAMSPWQLFGIALVIVSLTVLQLGKPRLQ